MFDKVDFIELEKEEAQKVVDDYNIVARALLPPPEKRFRDNDRWGGGNRYGGEVFFGRKKSVLKMPMNKINNKNIIASKLGI